VAGDSEGRKYKIGNKTETNDMKNEKEKNYHVVELAHNFFLLGFTLTLVYC